MADPTPPIGFTFEERWYSAASLAQHFDCHRNTIWRWSRAGLLPKPEQVSPGTTRWWGPSLNAHFAAPEAA